MLHLMASAADSLVCPTKDDFVVAEAMSFTRNGHVELVPFRAKRPGRKMGNSSTFIYWLLEILKKSATRY